MGEQHCPVPLGTDKAVTETLKLHLSKPERTDLGSMFPRGADLDAVLPNREQKTEEGKEKLETRDRCLSCTWNQGGLSGGNLQPLVSCICKI